MVQDLSRLAETIEKIVDEKLLNTLLRHPFRLYLYSKTCTKLWDLIDHAKKTTLLLFGLFIHTTTLERYYLQAGDLVIIILFC